jgi:hypothetical protein
MQSTVVEPKRTVGEEIVAVPDIAGKEIVKGAEVVGKDVEQGVIDLGTAVVNVTKAVGSEITRAGSRFEGGGPQAPEVRTESLKPVALGASPATVPGVPPVVTPTKIPPAPTPIRVADTPAAVPPTIPVTTPTTPAPE